MIVLLVGLAFADAPPWRGVVDDPAYPFCGVEGVDAEEARAWCDLLDEVPPGACPGLRATCAGAADGGTTDDWRERLSQGCKGASSPARAGAFTAPPEPPTPREGCAPPPTDAPSMGTSVLRWVVAIGVAVLVVGIGRFLWVAFGFGRKALATRPAPPPVGRAVVAPDAAELTDAPSGDLLAAARQALAEGRADDAVLLARAALLRTLAERGALVLDPARTDREYARALRGKPAEAGVRELVGYVEGIRWGGRGVGAEVAARAIAAAERVIVGAVALILLLAAPEARAGRYGPDGDAALRPMFERAGYEASWRLRGLGEIEDDLDVLVLDAEAVALDTADRAALRAWVERGGLLVVAGELPDGFPEVGPRIEVPPSSVSIGPDAPLGLPVPRWPLGIGAAYEGGSAERWVVTPEGHGAVLAARVGEGGLIAIADGRLLSNGALLVRRNEGFLLAGPMLGDSRGDWSLPPAPRLQIATRGGSDAQSPMGALWSGRLLPLVLQLLFVGALVALWRGWPFAPLREPPRGERASFAEHVRALGLRYARGRATARALALSGGWWLDRLGREGFLAAARKAGLPEGRGEALLVSIVAARADSAGTAATLKDLEDLWTLTRRR